MGQTRPIVGLLSKYRHLYLTRHSKHHSQPAGRNRNFWGSNSFHLVHRDKNETPEMPFSPLPPSAVVQLQPLLWSPETRGFDQAQLHRHRGTDPALQIHTMAQTSQLSENSSRSSFVLLISRPAVKMSAAEKPAFALVHCLLQFPQVQLPFIGWGWVERPWEEGDHRLRSSAAARVFSPRNWAHAVLLRNKQQSVAIFNNTTTGFQLIWCQPL